MLIEEWEPESLVPPLQKTEAVSPEDSITAKEICIKGYCHS